MDIILELLKEFVKVFRDVQIFQSARRHVPVKHTFAYTPFKKNREEWDGRGM